MKIILPSGIEPSTIPLTQTLPLRNDGHDYYKLLINYLQATYSHFIIQPEVIDITVEDPSQDFQRIRDYVDAKNCESLTAFQPEKLTQGCV